MRNIVPTDLQDSFILGFVELPRRKTVLLSGLIVVVAMFTGVTQAGEYAIPSQSAAVWLESQQDVSDGSWQDISETRTFLQTTEAMLALHQINLRRRAYYSGQSWIENHDPKNLDARARRLLVLRATQSNATLDIDAIIAAVSVPVTGQAGWGLSKRYSASPLDTALALDALRTAGAIIDSSQAIAYLKATQLTPAGDKGWPTAAGGTTDSYTTARVIQVLSAFTSTDPALNTSIANAVSTLKTKVTISSAPHLRAAAALAYLRVDTGSVDARTLLDSLTAIQRTDGGFDAGVFATGIIVQAYAAAEGLDAVVNRERVDVPDAALRAAINESLGRGAMDQLNRGELAQLTTLDISYLGVIDLTGLEYAVNLTTLNAAYNLASNTTPISGLTNLTSVDLTGNPCVGCAQASTDGDVPIPFWALGALGATLMAAVGRVTRRGKSG